MLINLTIGFRLGLLMSTKNQWRQFAGMRPVRSVGWVGRCTRESGWQWRDLNRPRRRPNRVSQYIPICSREHRDEGHSRALLLGLPLTKHLGDFGIERRSRDRGFPAGKNDAENAGRISNESVQGSTNRFKTRNLFESLRSYVFGNSANDRVYRVVRPLLQRELACAQSLRVAPHTDRIAPPELLLEGGPEKTLNSFDSAR
jgi:hypothetical protein